MALVFLCRTDLHGPDLCNATVPRPSTMTVVLATRREGTSAFRSFFCAGFAFVIPRHNPGFLLAVTPAVGLCRRFQRPGTRRCAPPIPRCWGTGTRSPGEGRFRRCGLRSGRKKRQPMPANAGGRSGRFSRSRDRRLSPTIHSDFTMTDSPAMPRPAPAIAAGAPRSSDHAAGCPCHAFPRHRAACPEGACVFRLNRVLDAEWFVPIFSQGTNDGFGNRGPPGGGPCVHQNSRDFPALKPPTGTLLHNQRDQPRRPGETVSDSPPPPRYPRRGKQPRQPRARWADRPGPGSISRRRCDHSAPPHRCALPPFSQPGNSSCAALAVHGLVPTPRG